MKSNTESFQWRFKYDVFLFDIKIDKNISDRKNACHVIFEKRLQ